MGAKRIIKQKQKKSIIKININNNIRNCFIEKKKLKNYKLKGSKE